MKRAYVGLFAMAFVLVATAAAQAQDIAFVNLDKVLELTEKGKDMQKKLSAMKDELELEIRQIEMNLQKMQEELETQKDVLSEDAKKTKFGEFQKDMGEYQKKAMEGNQKLEGYRAKLVRQFRGDLEAVASQVGKAKGFKMVIVKIEDPIFSLPIVIYGDPSVDVTDAVVKALNEQPAAK